MAHTAEIIPIRSLDSLSINNPSAAATATTGLGKLHGLMTDRGIIEHKRTIAHKHEPVSKSLELLREWREKGQDKLS